MKTCRMEVSDQSPRQSFSLPNQPKKPADWDSIIVKFAEADRSSFDAIRKARPDQEKGKQLLMQFVENAKKQNCVPQIGYIKSMGLKAE